METLQCPRCRADVPSAARFCPACGSAASPGDALTVAADATLQSLPGNGTISSSSSINAARFVPGQLLADRYRIVALLGEGGMGEVYRADDLRLGQTVAMKFLPQQLSHDGAALARFHQEVRIARQVSHANVCRVFDVGETQGLQFITMEYVDGEDLRSLLQRIGRLPEDKAVDISRQLCAGLAAAHDAGVLHRDLKPANVMLDRRGKVRITDFGLAGLSDVEDGSRGGTPAYMAPEQLSGGKATVQSDIYSLGLVIYEVFTGKQAFQGATLADLIRSRESVTPTSPTKLVQTIDPLVERVILRCLERDPQDRPASAIQVAAALPGGDPLAAALAAGETPSPEMVAAAGTEHSLRPVVAWIMAVVPLLSLAAILLLSPYSTDLGLAPGVKAPEALEDRAQDVLKDAGVTTPAADTAAWFERNYDFLLYRADNMSPRESRRLANAEQGVLTYFYRRSPDVLAPMNANGMVQTFDPPQEVAGMATVVLDSYGKLNAFARVPPQIISHSPDKGEPDYASLIRDSGFEQSTMTPTEPRWLPPVPFDKISGWDTHYPQDPNNSVHVVAASYHGMPVYFQVISPWSRPWRTEPVKRTRTRSIRDTTFFIGGFVTLVLGAILARRNIKLGRGDRRGAFRIASYVFAILTVSNLLIVHHTADLAAEWNMVAVFLPIGLFLAAFVWLYYLAFEPYVRRQWPELLISWTRLLSGAIQDPLVGRDVLVGLVFGSLLGVADHLVNALPAWFNIPGQTPIGANPLTLGSFAHTVGWFLLLQERAIFPAFATMFTIFVIRLLVKNYWLTVAISGILVLLLNLGNENVKLELPGAILLTVLTLVAILRFGLLALVVTTFVRNMLISFPITLDFSRWYAPSSYFMMIVLVGLAVYGLRACLGGVSFFSPAAHKRLAAARG